MKDEKEPEKFEYVKEEDWKTALKQCEAERKNIEISRVINDAAMDIIKAKLNKL